MTQRSMVKSETRRAKRGEREAESGKRATADGNTPGHVMDLVYKHIIVECSINCNA